MPELDRLKRAINESGELSRRGNNREALRLIDDLVAQAIQENRPSWVTTLCRHAAVICDHAGEIDLVTRYCEQALAYSPDDALSFYKLADVSLRQGRMDTAKEYAAKSYRICKLRSEQERGLMELLLKQWPELAEPFGSG